MNTRIRVYGYTGIYEFNRPQLAQVNRQVERQGVDDVISNDVSGFSAIVDVPKIHVSAAGIPVKKTDSIENRNAEIFQVALLLHLHLPYAAYVVCLFSVATCQTKEKLNEKESLESF